MSSVLLLCKLTTSLTGLDGYLGRFDEFKYCSVFILLWLSRELFVYPSDASESQEQKVAEGEKETDHEANWLEGKVKSSGRLGLLGTGVAMITISRRQCNNETHKAN